MATEYKYQFGARLQEILQLRSITQTELSEDSGDEALVGKSRPALGGRRQYGDS